MKFILHKVSIGELGRIVTGRTPPTSNRLLFGSEYPFITPTDIDDGRYCVSARSLSARGAESQRQLLLPENAVCVTCIGSIGKMCMTDRPSFTNQQINAIVVDETRFDAFFVYYALRNIAATLPAIASGAGVPIINKRSFSQVQLEVPPLPIQRRIASILSAYDDLIENCERRIRVLDEMARALYREWFVNYRYPGHESVPLVDSKIGKVPRTWSVRRLDQLAEIRGGRQLSKDRIRATGLFSVFGGNGIQGYTDRATHEGFVIAFGRVGANCGSIHWSYKGAWINNNASSIVPSMHDELVLHHLREFQFGNLRRGAAQPFIANESLEAIELVWPDDETAAKFCAIARRFHAQADLFRETTTNLRQTRDLLLPRLLSGQLSVVEEAA